MELETLKKILCDLQGYSRSLTLSPFDKPHVIYYQV